MVIVRDVDRLTRNLADWERFEKAAIEHHVLLSLTVVPAGARVRAQSGKEDGYRVA